MKKFDNGTMRFNIFPTLVYILDCSDLIDEVKTLKETIVWNDSRYHGQSENLYCLNQNKQLVDTIENRVNDCLLECDFSNKFRMSTSWFTRIAPYGHIESHHHTNCIWSSSFYFNDNCGHITFMKNAYGVHVPQDCSDPDLGMSGDINFPCEKGKLILFPSQLKHKVVSNQSDDIRYSMAMNFVPDGEVKCGDSSFNYG
mgnify:FL=1|jgi:uncharacterized protein (TIGR02466 family)|tara:strand:+ start:26 stop:622 length:597 start_codon:yes stop_codon:yes gene_type:complete